jgi:hypothetical protein
MAAYPTTLPNGTLVLSHDSPYYDQHTQTCSCGLCDHHGKCYRMVLTDDAGTVVRRGRGRGLYAARSPLIDWARNNGYNVQDAAYPDTTDEWTAFYRAHGAPDEAAQTDLRRGDVLSQERP